VKIRLIKPPSIQYYHPRNAYALGLLYIGAVLEKEGHNVWAYDMVNISLKQCLHKTKRIMMEKPEYLGINCDSHNRYSCFKIAKLAKKMHPKTKIVLGGLHASYYYREILNKIPQIDAILLGEAEYTFRDLLNTEWEECAGIAFRKNNIIKVTKNRNKIQNLDELPIPKHEYFVDFIDKYGEAYINSSRGCPSRCRFCSPLGYWGGFRSRSADSVMKEIEYLLEKFPSLRHIYFQEQCFTYDRTRVMEICNRLIQKGSPITWECETRVDTVDITLLEHMKKAGCIQVDYGIESGSEKIFKILCKDFTVQQCDNAFRWTQVAGLRSCAYLIVGSPGENRSTLRQTRRFLAKNIRNITEIQISFYYIYPWSPFFRNIYNKRFNWFKNQRTPILYYRHSFFKTWFEIEKIRFSFIFSKGPLYLIERLILIFKDKKFNYYKNSLFINKLFNLSS